MMETIYTAIAHASGGGRDGHVRSEDDLIDMQTRPPKELGGSGEGTNPEQLFAAGYAACFLSAIHAVGRTLGTSTTDAAVSASVNLGSNGEGGFGLSVELHVYVPSVSAEEREKLVEAAHQVCPYSTATRGNVEVILTLVD